LQRQHVLATAFQLGQQSLDFLLAILLEQILKLLLQDFQLLDRFALVLASTRVGDRVPAFSCLVPCTSEKSS